jgi:hypothetical protein
MAHGAVALERFAEDINGDLVYTFTTSCQTVAYVAVYHAMLPLCPPKLDLPDV